MCLTRLPGTLRQWHSRDTLRLQLRGQPRLRSLMGTPHRVPFSSAFPIGQAEPSKLILHNLVFVAMLLSPETQGVINGSIALGNKW